MVAKKYKLYSVSSESGSVGPCAFFASEAGCRNGEACKFLHVLPDAIPEVKEESSDSSSVVSSESEGEIPPVATPAPMSAPVPAPAPSATTEPAANQNSKKKKKKRKNPDSSEDIFASPKSHNANKGTNVAQSSGKKQKAVQQKNTPQSAPKKQKTDPAVVTQPPSREQPNNAVADFRSLDLPITSFSTANPKTAVVKAETPASPTTAPLPTHTPTGRKWKNAVVKTREHVRYSASFDFEKLKESEEEAGLAYATDWVTARKFGPWCIENPQAIALDCEMCETRDPVTGAVDSKALCRVSIINAENRDEVLLDSLVKPAWPVVDHRSHINGIKEEHLANVQFTLRHAQAFLMALCSDETVIIGHALHNDLAALKVEHHCLVDSSFMFPVKDAPNATPSLKDLALNLLNKEMPPTHDSVNDAGAALQCLEVYLAKKGKVSPIERSALRNPVAASQLFVHRIPKKCQSAHLNTMFLTHTTVQPAEVDEIEFTGDTGRTHVTFRSSRHANLAFDALEGKEEADKSGRMQKKVYLKSGGYVRVRMMVHPRAPRRESTGAGKSNDSK